MWDNQRCTHIVQIFALGDNRRPKVHTIAHPDEWDKHIPATIATCLYQLHTFQSQIPWMNVILALHPGGHLETWEYSHSWSLILSNCAYADSMAEQWNFDAHPRATCRICIWDPPKFIKVLHSAKIILFFCESKMAEAKWGQKERFTMWKSR